MKRRLALLRFTLQQRSLAGPAANWMFNCFAPTCEVLARRCIVEEQVEEDFRRLKFRGCPGYLYYPASLPTRMLYQTVAEQFYPKNWHYYEMPQTMVGPEDVVVDCGSAEGLFTLVSSQRARQVVAVEPLLEFQRALEKTFAGSANVQLERCALGRTSGTAFMQSSGICSNLSGNSGGQEIEVLPLDKLCRDRGIECSYLKADVEGFEQQLLEGAAEMIARRKPKIAITTYHGTNDSAKMGAFLRKLVPEYQILCKGIEAVEGKSVMLHAWVGR